jgi:uncharacterized membrane protein YeaQ/YmgE (transglycosylase-associated protein family)
MDYLFMKLIWWIALAFVLGTVAGWISCGNAEEDL